MNAIEWLFVLALFVPPAVVVGGIAAVLAASIPRRSAAPLGHAQTVSH